MPAAKEPDNNQNTKQNTIDRRSFLKGAAAAGAAAAIQRQVASAPWRVPAGLRLRAAVHSGAVYRRDEDVFGTAVNRLARLVELCPPGAVLVSAAKPDPEYRSGEIF